MGCWFLGITRQAYYKRLSDSQQRTTCHARILSFVQVERLAQPRIGTRKLHVMLAQSGISIGRDSLFALLRRHRMLVLPRRAYHKTTNSHHRFHCHPNLLKAGPNQVTPTRPEHVWVADITYLSTRSGDAYLSLVTDAYSRKIMGYHVDDNLRAESVALAYAKALKARHGGAPLIHHSDRGIQYCSGHYQQIHHKHQVKCSMTDGYDCYQNALAERVNGILKNELLLTTPNNLQEARKMVAESVAIYNKRRPHMALKYKTPDEVHRAF